MRQGINLGVFALITVNTAKTCEGVLSVDIHGTGATYALSAGSAECQCGVDFIFYLDEGIENLCQAFSDE